MSRKPSTADTALINEMTIRDVHVTVRQLDRWRAAGLIRTERQWGGPGRGGSSSRYPEGTADLIEELVEILSKDRSLDLAALTLFARGHEIDEDGLKAAYTSSYNALAEYGAQENDTDDWDRAQSISERRRYTSHPVVRAWRKRVRQRSDRGPVSKETRAIGASVIHVLQTGEPIQDEAASIVAQASGVDEIAGSEELTMDFADTLADLSFPALAQTVESATTKELARARDSLKKLAGFLSQASDIFQEPDDLQVALVAPALIQIMRIAGPWWEELLPQQHD